MKKLFFIGSVALMMLATGCTDNYPESVTNSINKVYEDDIMDYDDKTDGYLIDDYNYDYTYDNYMNKDYDYNNTLGNDYDYENDLNMNNENIKTFVTDENNNYMGDNGANSY